MAVLNQSPLFLSLFSTLLPTSRVTSSILWTLCDAFGALALIKIWRARQRVSKSSRDGLIAAACVSTLFRSYKKYRTLCGLELMLLSFSENVEPSAFQPRDENPSMLHLWVLPNIIFDHFHSLFFQLSSKPVLILADSRFVDVDIRKYADSPFHHVRQPRCVHQPITLVNKHKYSRQPQDKYQRHYWRWPSLSNCHCHLYYSWSRCSCCLWESLSHGLHLPHQSHLTYGRRYQCSLSFWRILLCWC